MVLLFADEDGDPLPATELEQCDGCGELFDRFDLRFGEDDRRYCEWCYDSAGQDPGALQGIDP